MPTPINLANLPRTIEMEVGDGSLAVSYIDQRLLPYEQDVERTSDWRVVVDAVKALAVRGAPAIGLAGAAALALWAQQAACGDLPDGAFARAMESAADEIADARPTAVNLRWAVDRALGRARELLAQGAAPAEVATGLGGLVREMQREDEAANRAMGENGAALIAPGSRILTHCNAGSLATYFYGTALGVVYSAAAQGKVERVYADETRPVGQGARLTAWELSRAGIPVTLICDNMAASLMVQEKIDAVLVGADRIARNGDAANKIGTYGVAVLAHEHGVPFYVVAPTSTVDASISDGSQIVIEQRDPAEVLPRPIDGVDVWNPAFDVTPARYITKIVTESGVFSPGELATTL